MEERHLAALDNAFASFNDLETLSSPPSHPLKFADAEMYHARRIMQGTVYDRAEDLVFDVENIVYCDNLGIPPDRAYWIQRKLKKTIYGCVRFCRILKRCDIDTSLMLPNPIFTSQDPAANILWEITDDLAAVKICDWDIIRSMNGLHREDPLQEISAMQLVHRLQGMEPGEDESSRVLSLLDVLSDSNYLFIFMPYCNSGELYTHVEAGGRLLEPLARYFFKQLLDGLLKLQKAGVCHRDMSLENILVHDSDIVIIDLGMCLRVPFTPADGNPNGAADVTSRTLRKLILPQGQCGKPNYIAPEIVENILPFDGFAIDTWAAGVILFIFLVGIPPWDWATLDDARFRMIALDGRLDEMLRQWGRPISSSASDLLQGIFRRDPRERLTFGQIMDHPWVRSTEVHLPEFQSSASYMR